MNKNAAYYIEKLGMTRHVEGGSFVESYRSTLKIPQDQLGQDFGGDRNISTAIYFLLEHGQFSAFHKIASDEMWHFYDGNPLSIYEITQEGKLIHHKLGNDLENGEAFQILIKAGNWFGSRCEIENGFSLVACTVAPGFDFEDFEMAKKEELIANFPAYAKLLKEMCQE